MGRGRALLQLLRAQVASVGADPSVGGKNVIAFSGGVDSSVVAALVHDVFPANSVACVGVSSALPASQLHLARDVARRIGISLKEVYTKEGSDPEYVANRGMSCFHCKTHLYSSLEAVAALAGSESRDTVTAHGGDSVAGGGCQVVLFNGTNKDDKRDPTRSVGLKAAENFRVASPIDGLTKAEVREVAQALGLQNWNFAASPCLRSRLAFGVEATPDRLMLVEQAENIVRKYLRLGVTDNLRVRAMHEGDALVEVDQEQLERGLSLLEELRGHLIPMGFKRVNMRVFRSGALSG
ncbi:unnamed protein product, partial [Discosporangium mesarthrocarpum]